MRLLLGRGHASTDPPRVWITDSGQAHYQELCRVRAVSHEDPVLTAPRGEPATTSAEPEQEELPRLGTQNLLTQGPSTAPVSLRGRPMYNACALLPESEIIAMGLRIHTFVQANSDHLSRDVADPQLTGAVAEASTCIHYVESPTGQAAPESGDSVGEIAGILHLIVKQAPFTDDGPYSSLRDKTERYRDRGIQPNHTSGVLWYQDTADYLDADELNFYLFRPAATDTLFDVPPARAVLTPELFAEYTGEPDSGFVRETYSRGERSFSEYSKVLGLHVESTCVRRSAAKAVEPWAGVGLEAKVQTFRDQWQAERTLESNCASRDTFDVDHKIGVATCLWRAGADYLMFNAGRYNVWLSVDRKSQPPPEALVSNLIPIAERSRASCDDGGRGTCGCRAFHRPPARGPRCASRHDVPRGPARLVGLRPRRGGGARPERGRILRSVRVPRRPASPGAVVLPTS